MKREAKRFTTEEQVPDACTWCGHEPHNGSGCLSRDVRIGGTTRKPVYAHCECARWADLIHDAVNEEMDQA